MNAKNLFIGGVVAVATGAILGVLFAPDKGSVTRKKISKQGSRYLEDLKNSANEYVDTLEEKYDDVVETAVDITGKVKGAVDALAAHEPQKQAHRT